MRLVITTKSYIKLRNNKGLIYFNNLNGLRAIAALLVVLAHVNDSKKKLGAQISAEKLFFNFPIGGLAVTFFFVLSGFLITYLLLQEAQLYKKVNVKQFYFRRILKIWPLYFMLTAIGLTYFFSKKIVVISTPSLICHLFILPNFAIISNPLCFQSWSVGVEEQFYLVWPIIINKKSIWILSILIIISFFICRSLPEIYLLLKIECPPAIKNLNTFILQNRFDSMAIGALLAYVQFNKLIKNSISKTYKYLFYLLFAVCFLIGNKFYFGTLHFIFSLLFAVFIYIQINEEGHNKLLESKVLTYLGKISYGIYMWHVIGIYLAIRFCKLISPGINYSTFSFNIVLYLLSLVITIGIAMISYIFFESYFLRLKHTFHKHPKPKKNIENIIYL